MQLTSNTQTTRLRKYAHTKKLLGNSDIMKVLFNRTIAILFFHQVIFGYQCLLFLNIKTLKCNEKTRIKWKLLKGYLCYKMILPNLCHLKHSLRIFLFSRKVMFRSQDIQPYVFLTIPWITKSVMSWWVLVYETGCIFEYMGGIKVH